MQKSVVSTQTLAKIYRAWLKECAYYKIQQYYDQTSKNCILYCKSMFSMHIFNAFELMVLSYRLFYILYVSHKLTIWKLPHLCVIKGDLFEPEPWLSWVGPYEEL